jgi:hypothetical protein
MPTSLLPNSFHGSTTFNSVIKSYDHLAQRIRMALGEPLVQIEISSEQIYNNIDFAIEYFTKFAGNSEEFLIFRSDLYIRGVGLPIARLINITPDLVSTIDPGVSSLEASYNSNPNTSYDNPYYLPNNSGWDYDLNDYRKVVDVYSFAEGNNAGVNTLFTIEHTIAQQAYFGHLLGNVGYDLVTWQSLKGWLETREKVLALTPYLRFYPEKQLLKIIPEPSNQLTYFGLVACKIQKPLKELISQLWVYRYALALTKISVGHVRGKYAGSNLFGGQTVNYTDLMAQGIAERDKLEAEITSDLIDRDPIRFFVG